MIAVIRIDWVPGPIITVARTCDGYVYNGEPAWYTIEGQIHLMKYCEIIHQLDVLTFEEAIEQYPEWLI